MNPRELALARQLYVTAINAGASPVNAAFLVGSAYQESSFQPSQTGSDGGSSFGLLQVGSAMWRQMVAAGLKDDPAGQMDFYIRSMQSHAPSTWASMQNANDVRQAYSALHANPDWRMGQIGDRFNYANQFDTSNAGRVSFSDTPELASQLSNYFNARGPQNVVPQNEQFTPVDSAFQSRNVTPSNEQFSPVDNYNRQPVDTVGLDYEPLNPVDSYNRGINPAPWNETLNPVDTYSGWNPAPSNESLSPVDNYSQQPIGTGSLDYEPLSPVDIYSDQISSSGGVTDNPFADSSWTTPVNESSSGEVTDNPFADPSWLPQYDQQTQDNRVTGAPPSDIPVPEGFGDIPKPPDMPPVEGFTGGFGVGAGPQYGVTKAGFSTGYTPFGGGGVGPQFSGGGSFDSSTFQPRQGFFGLGSLNAAGGSMPVGISKTEGGIEMRSQGDGGRDTKKGMSVEEYLGSFPEQPQTAPQPQRIGSYIWQRGMGGGMQATNVRGYYAPVYEAGTGINAPMPTSRALAVARG